MRIVAIYMGLMVADMALGWDPDAGLVKSYTKLDNVSVTVTSGTNAHNVIDSDYNTQWSSQNCLPTGYYGRHDVNVLLDACASGNCVSGGTTDLTDATDGSVYTVSSVKSNGTLAVLSISVATPQQLRVVSVNGVFHDATSLFAIDQQMNKHLVRTFNSTDNYKNINIDDVNFLVAKLELSSAVDFSVKEVASVGSEGCTEQVTVDLGTVRSLGTIRTRHWAGTNSATKLVLRTSADGHTWKDIADLDPSALRPITTSIQPESAQFVALKYTVTMANYQHIYCWEIDAWDEHGVYGPHIAPVRQTKSFGELLGVNGIWGWGTSQYSDSITNNNEGPLLYQQVASHARNYHNMVWDVTDPDLDPEFDQMALGHGTQAKWWLDWDREYNAWDNANMSVDISLQFTNKTVPQYKWNTPEASAFHYGQEIAKHFGSVQGNGLVQAVEVGNEPWDYEATFYAKILRSMSSGLKSADNKITVLPGAFQADDKDDTGNYIGTRVLPDMAGNLDVLNLHTYSFINDDAGIRRGTYPENKLSSFNSVRPFARWRDTNTPTKPIWVTEWGWDGDSDGEGCTGTECVSEKAQAVYAIRGLMLLARSNIERATWYFFANTADCSTLFCRSGLTTSANTHFRRNAVFYAFEALLQHIGEARFIGIVQENDDGFVYALRGPSSTGNGRRKRSGRGRPVERKHPDGRDLPDIRQNKNVPLCASRKRSNKLDLLKDATHLVAWLPVDISNTTSHHVTFDLPAGLTANGGVEFTGISGAQSTHTLDVNNFVQTGHSLTLTLTTQPMIINLVHSEAPGIVG